MYVELLSYTSFPLLSFLPFPFNNLLLSVSATIITKMYHDDKAYANILVCISSVIQRQVFDRIRDLQFFGIMVDESTDIFVLEHFVGFATFFEDGVLICTFLDLLQIPRSRKDAIMIYELILTSLNQWGLDLDKFVGFGYDGASIMTGICK